MSKEDHQISRLLRDFFVLLILSCLAACSLLSRGTPTPSPVPLSAWTTKWLTQPACQPPCWEEITPGVTTITDTILILGDVPGIKI